jgi:alpha-N-arabinofuranosidase
MIKDRKFYYSVNESFIGDPNDKSPWHVTSIGTIVKMDTIHAFVGKHSPRIDLNGQMNSGIAQEELTLRQGKSYSGRIILSGSDSIVVKVSLIWGSGPEDRQTIIINKLTQGYTPTPLQFNITANTDNGCLEIIGEGRGSFYVGTVLLMPIDNIQGMRADVINLLKQLNATVYRWPGGSFVNGYNWRLAIGDRDKRIPTINHSYWSEQIESNDFGLDEFMLMVRMLGAQPYIAVSAMNNGDEQMAAEEVEYLNGSTTTPMGKIRAMNGHPLPYGVRFWGVGNEAYFFAALN